MLLVMVRGAKLFKPPELNGEVVFCRYKADKIPLFLEIAYEGLTNLNSIFQFPDAVVGRTT